MRSTLKKIFLAIACTVATKAMSQNYQAENSSPYAGAMSMFTNPASTCNVNSQWDLLTLGAQVTTSNDNINVVHSKGFLASNSKNSFGMTSGIALNSTIAASVDLLNFRHAIGNRAAWGFGLRIRGYAKAYAPPVYSNDGSLIGINNYLPTILQQNLQTASIAAVGTSWAELNVNYSRIVYENKNRRLSVGANLGYTKGIIQESLRVYNFGSGIKIDPTSTTIYATDGNVEALSSIPPNLGNTDYLNSLLQFTPTFNFSFGVEYMFRNTSQDDGDIPISPTNYDWKFGFSVMDIGSVQFIPSNTSVRLSHVKPILFSDLTAQIKGTTLPTQVFNNVDSVKNNYSVSLPTRAIFSVDKNFGHNMYVSGQLSLNFFSVQNLFSSKLRTQENNFITITPRWETQNLGFYLPTQMDFVDGRVWFGTAFRFYCLIFGVHDIPSLVGILQNGGMQKINGGLYLAIQMSFAKEAKENDRCLIP